jgi:hypothetical protein
MMIMVLFALGVANFAMHKAVLESGHPIVARTFAYFGMMNGRFGLVLEFVALLGAMLMVDAGMAGWAWAYMIYSFFNTLSAWFILTDRL